MDEKRWNSTYGLMMTEYAAVDRLGKVEAKSNSSKCMEV